MAVFNPQPENLSGAYGNITQQLQQRSNLELKRPNVEDVGTQIVQRIDTELTKQRDFEKKMAGEGRQIFTKDMASELSDQLGVPAETFSSALNRYYSPKEFEEAIQNAMKPVGVKSLREGAGKPGGLTDLQMQGLNATGEQGDAALAQYLFPKALSSGGGRKTVNVEDPNTGKVHVVPIELVGPEFDASTFDYTKFPLAGFKPTTTKNPETGEVINVAAGSGKARGITGPAPKPKDVPLRNDYSQLNAKERERVDQASKDVMADPVIKDIRETNAKLGSLRKLIEENLPQGVGIVQSRVARFLASERGALAEGDVARASGSQSYENQLNTLINKARGEGLTDADVKGFLVLLDGVQQSSNNVLNQSIDQQIFRVRNKGMQDVDPKVFRQAIGIGAPTGGEAQVIGRRKANQ